jgi:4-amino-4-deoxy-L-arabinose transferase-like glycosyltransferase
MAPKGFLLAEKAAVSALGANEYALRLFPLLAGVSSIFVFYRLMRRMGNDAVAFIALLVFSFSDRLIYYCSEAKQYSTDVLASVLCLLIFVHRFETDSEGPSWTQALLWGLAGGVIVCFSHPVIFVLTGIGLWLLARSLLAKDHRRIGRSFVTMAIWLVSFTLNYVLFMSGDRTLALMRHQIWTSAFAPLVPKSTTDLKWFVNGFRDLVRSTVGINPAIAAILIIFAFFAERRATALMFALPIGLALIASALKLYPFDDRLLLFTTPAMAYLVAQGACNATTQVIEKVRNNSRFPPLLLAPVIILTMALPVARQVRNFIHPPAKEEVRSAMKFIHDNNPQRLPICVDGCELTAFEFYQPAYVEPGTPVEYFDASDTGLTQVRTHDQCWILLSDFSACYVAGALARLSQAGKLVAQHRYPGVSACLIDLVPR